MIRAAVRAALILGLAGLAVYAFTRGEGGETGGRLYRQLIDRIFGDGSYGLFDRLYVCIPGNLKAAWDNPVDPSLDSDTREWIGVHRTRVAVIAKSLGYTNHPHHTEHRGAAFGVEVPNMPSEPAVRARQLAYYRKIDSMWPEFVNPERKNPCDRRGTITQENKLTFSRWEPKKK